MKIYQLYNESRAPFGGDAAVLATTMRVLTDNGHRTRLVIKSSKILDESMFMRLKAFWDGAYSISAFRSMRKLLKEDRPDVVHVHSLYPMFSPSVLVACREEGVPIVMTVHDHSLTCPTRFHLYKGRVCEECLGGHEYRCILKNCRNNILESCAYALRSAVARRFGLFVDTVSLLIVMTPFGKTKLVQAGFPATRIVIVPNPARVNEVTARPSSSKYVAFAGRVNAEKGVDVLLAAAAQMPSVCFKIAGDGPLLQSLASEAPANIEFLGQLGADQLSEFYRRSRVLVVPSICLETFGMVVAEAMACGVPVIASRIGGLPSVVDDGVTGLLFEPGNSTALVGELQRLWNDPALADQMGAAGREKALREYSERTYYESLMTTYRAAIQNGKNSPQSTPLVQLA